MDHKIKLLLVEDEAVSAIYMKIQLRKLNYDVLNPATTGEEAIKIAKFNKPDIVLMDIRLAGKMDGIDAAQEILSFCNAKIIFMTGYENVELKDRAKKLNPAGYLIKPFDILDVKKLMDPV
jgi:two-component system, response regulator PdtaR